jgi:non-heme Fe2+,alpha-ketoglutarate-dependent halogenase
MSMNMGLSPSEVESFHRDGFFGPFRVYEGDEASTVRKKLRAAVQDRKHAPYPESDINYDRHLDVSVLSKHILRPQIVHRIQSLIGPDTLCWRTEFFPKYPGQGGTQWHQVETFAYGSGTPCLVPTTKDPGLMEITVWTALTDASKENGCLRFIPGSHKDMRFHERKLERFDQLSTDGGFFGYDFNELKKDPTWEIDESRAVEMVMSEGEAVIFTERVLHGSLPNTTSRETRLGMSARYVPTHVQVYPGQSVLVEHGQSLNLARWGAVLASGTDRHGLNRVVSTNARGEPFVPVSAT